MALEHYLIDEDPVHGIEWLEFLHRPEYQRVAFKELGRDFDEYIRLGFTLAKWLNERDERFV